MAKTNMIHASLLGASSALGYNWIYDTRFLKEYTEGKEVLFQPVDHKAYKLAKAAFDVYPSVGVGDFDFMGEVLYLLHMFLKNGKDLTPISWRDTIYNAYKEDSKYDGYIEHYGVDLIEKVVSSSLHMQIPSVYTDYIDKQLIGPALLLAIYENDKFANKVDETLKYSKVLTAYSGVEYFVNLLNNLFNDLNNGVAKFTALKGNIKYAPTEYQEALENSLTATDQNSFIKEYSGVACGLDQSFPLIYYIVNHTNTWEEALRLNAVLGGASCARGIFLSAIFNILDEVPDKYIDKLNKKI